jgi:hypothetical protein
VGTLLDVEIKWSPILFKGRAAWLVEAAGAGVLGLGIGLLAIPVTSRVLSPLWRRVKSLFPARIPRKGSG